MAEKDMATVIMAHLVCPQCNNNIAIGVTPGEEVAVMCDRCSTPMQMTAKATSVLALDGFVERLNGLEEKLLALIDGDDDLEDTIPALVKLMQRHSDAIEALRKVIDARLTAEAEIKARLALIEKRVIAEEKPEVDDEPLPRGEPSVLDDLLAGVFGRIDAARERARRR